MFNQGKTMDKMELIKDNLAKIDKAIEAAVFAGGGLNLIWLLKQRGEFVFDVCSQIDRDAVQRGPHYECWGKETTAEINYQRILNLAIEKARKKADVRHEELPAAISGKHYNGWALTSCPNGLSPKVGSMGCYEFCPHFVEKRGNTVYCRYPERSR